MNRKTGVVLSYVLMLVEIVSTLFFTPFFIRTLGNAEYGIYQLIMSVTAYLALLDLGVGYSVVRYMSKFRTENNRLLQRKFLGVTTIYYLIIGLVILIVGLIIRHFLPSFFKTGLTADEIVLARKLFFVTILTTAVSLMTSGFSNAIIAYERFTISKGTMIAMTAVKMLASILVLKLGYSSYGVVLVNFFITLFTRLVYVAFVLFKLKIIPLFKGIEFSFIKDIVSYSLFILLQLIASHINALSDQVLLAAFAKDAAVIIAVYGVGAQILQYFRTVSSHITSVLMPGLVRLVESGAKSEDYQKEMTRISRIVFMVLAFVWVVFAVFGKDFIGLWAGEGYYNAYYVALALMLPNLFEKTELVGNQLLQAMQKHKKPAVIQVISALLNIVLTIILIKWKPLAGAVIGSFTAYFVCDVIVMNIMYKEQIGIKLSAYFKGIFKGTLVCLIISTVVGLSFAKLNLIRLGWLGFLINCAAMCVTYAAAMLLFGMNDYEKQLLFKPIRKLIPRLK